MRYHSSEPWRAGKAYASIVSDRGANEHNGADDVEHYGGHLVAESIGYEDRRRILACVNALANFSTDGLETEVSVGRRIARIEWSDGSVTTDVSDARVEGLRDARAGLVRGVAAIDEQLVNLGAMVDGEFAAPGGGR